MENFFLWEVSQANPLGQYPIAAAGLEYLKRSGGRNLPDPILDTPEKLDERATDWSICVICCNSLLILATQSVKPLLNLATNYQDHHEICIQPKQCQAPVHFGRLIRIRCDSHFTLCKSVSCSKWRWLILIDAPSALCLFAGCSTDSHRGIYGAQRLIHEQIMWVGHSWTELLSIFPTHLKEGGKLFIFHHCKMLASAEATNQPRKQTGKMSHKWLRSTSHIDAVWQSENKTKTISSWK